MDAGTRILVSHLTPARKRAIKESMRAIALNPLLGKPLQEDLLGLYSYRIGTIRIVYSIDRRAKTIHIVAIGPRKTIYEELERDLKRKSPFS